MIQHLSVAFYPEHIQESRWERDIALMKEHGIDSVRVLEFAWSRMERADGEFDFAWIHRFMKLLQNAGIGVIPCTPTAAPPAWLLRHHPECAAMDANGHRAGHGARRHYCPTSRLYREYGNRITRRMQEELGRYDNLVLWHLDNEFGWNKCHCPECNDAFRKAMKAKYQTPEQLNEAIGGAFWSEDFWEWEDLEIPRAGYSTVGGGSSPEMKLAFSQFFSDQTISFMTEQVEALRSAGCKLPISTNMMADFEQIDYWKQAEALDVVGWDNYFDVYTLAGDSLGHNLMRSLKGGKGFWTFENQVDTVDAGVPTAPGFNIVHALSAMAHGEIGHTFFRWDSCRFAQEQDLQGLVDWGGHPRAKLLEVGELRRILNAMSGLALPPVATPIALVFSYPNYWNTARYYGHYWEEVESFYQALFDSGFICDCVQPGADLSRYKLVLAPGLQIVTPGELENFRNYVRNGGVLLAGRKTFSKGPSGSYLDSSHPALGDVFGMRVIETHDSRNRNGLDFRGFYWAQSPEVSYPMVGHQNLPAAQSQGWFETLELQGAEALYTYEDGYYAGAGGTAASKNRFGDGSAYYLGTRIGREPMKALVCQALEEAHIGPVVDIPQGMQLVRRGNHWMVTNHSEIALTLQLPYPARLLHGTAPDGQTLTLPPYGWSLLEVTPS